MLLLLLEWHGETKTKTDEKTQGKKDLTGELDGWDN